MPCLYYSKGADVTF